MPHAASQEEWREESLRSPLLGSVAAHVLLLGAIALGGFLELGKKSSLGDKTPIGGGSISFVVNPVTLPNPSTRKNPVANDSKSQLPSPPKPEKVERAKEVEPDATPIKSRNAKKQAPKETIARNTPPKPIEERVYSRQGQQVSNPMYGRTTTGSGVSFTNANPFGDRFGAYAALLQQRVTQQWAQQLQNLNSRTTTPAYIMVEILANGSIRVPRVSRTSGDYGIDQAAMRAVQLASPFPPLPQGFGQSSAVVEFQVSIER